MDNNPSPLLSVKEKFIAMSMCPLCNGLDSLQSSCQQCGTMLMDEGRYMDYFDDYSAYLEIDEMKLVDGISDDQKNEQCPHVFTCQTCNTESVVLIKETPLRHM